MSSPNPDPLPIPADPGQAPTVGSAGLTHDLRAPVATIHAEARLLAQDLDRLDPTDIRQTTLAIHRGTGRLEQLVNTLHSLLALRDGRLAVAPAPLNGREHVDGSVGTAGPLLGASVYESAGERAQIRWTG
jgi:signal transduction histidine kinase